MQIAERESKNSGGELAGAVRREFVVIHKRFNNGASKKDFSRLREDVAVFRRDMEEGLNTVTGTLKAIWEKLNYPKGMAAEATSLRFHLARVERKVGLAN